MVQRSPAITIITVVRNAAREIEETFRSVAALKTNEVEYIVIDGLSEDNTVDIIKKYAAHIDYWLSEADNGIYDAMNKACRLAHGTYVIHINAGDKLLLIPQKLLSAPESADIYCGRVATEQGTIIPAWNKSLYTHNTIPHQGCFYRREVLLKRPYDLQFKIFADYDLNLRLFHDKRTAIMLNDVIAFHSVEGISNQPCYATELFRVVRQNCGKWGQFRSWTYFKLQGLLSRWKR